jgi:16S rRNA (guanine527-N7)-methyltransferase
VTGEIHEERDSGNVEELLLGYAAALRASPHNLLSARGVAELEDRHIPESLRFALALPEGPRTLDVGSGGGLPGLVVAIARPDLEVHLIEATGKKADFLAETAAALDLRVTVHRGRAEDLAGSDLAGSFDIVTARAVARLDGLIPLTAPFLRVGGQLHAIKGERWAEELAAAGSVMRRWGMRVLSVPEDRPGLDEAAGEAQDGPREDGPRVVVLTHAAHR